MISCIQATSQPKVFLALQFRAHPQLFIKKRLQVPIPLHLISMQENMLAPDESCSCSEWVLIHMARTLRRAMAHMQGSSKMWASLLGAWDLAASSQVEFQRRENWGFHHLGFLRRDSPPRDTATCVLGFTLAPGPELRSLYRSWPAFAHTPQHNDVKRTMLRIAKAGPPRAGRQWRRAKIMAALSKLIWAPWVSNSPAVLVPGALPFLVHRLQLQRSWTAKHVQLWMEEAIAS